MATIDPIKSVGLVNPANPAKVAQTLPDMGLKFQDLLDDAVAQQERINPYQGVKHPLTVEPESAVDQEILLARALPANPPQTPTQPNNQNTGLAGPVNQEIRSKKLDKTPFQLFLNKAVTSLEDISAMEMRVNDLIEQYVQGKASIDEVSIETQKLTMSISFATSVITSATTTFKEILQMQV